MDVDGELFPAFSGIIPSNNDFKENGTPFTVSGVSSAIVAPPAAKTNAIQPVTPTKPPRPVDKPIDIVDWCGTSKNKWTR